jgi:hypothetical protein
MGVLIVMSSLTCTVRRPSMSAIRKELEILPGASGMMTRKVAPRLSLHSLIPMTSHLIPYARTCPPRLRANTHTRRAHATRITIMVGLIPARCGRRPCQQHAGSLSYHQEQQQSDGARSFPQTARTAPALLPSPSSSQPLCNATVNWPRGPMRSSV